jgi:hypothetical protein
MLAMARTVVPPKGRQLPEASRSTAADHLRSLVTNQRELLAAIEDEVRRLLNQGHSWTVVGDAVGLSRQGARQRYRHLVADEPDAKPDMGGRACCLRVNR